MMNIFNIIYMTLLALLVGVYAYAFYKEWT